YALGRDGLAEEHHVGLEQAAAGRTGRYLERCEVDALEVGVAVGRGARVERGERGISRNELGLHAFPLEAVVAAQAAHGIDAPVKIDDRAAAGGLVQTVDVLRNQRFDAAQALEVRKCAVSG